MIKKYNKKILAFLIATTLYIFQQRLGMFIVSFLLLDFILIDNFTINKKTIGYVIFATILFIISFKLSVFLALKYYTLVGPNSFTFWGGFGGGIIELETYVFFSLIPLKWVNYKNLVLSLKKSSIELLICLIIGGFVQGSYLAGWQNLYI